MVDALRPTVCDNGAAAMAACGGHRALQQRSKAALRGDGVCIIETAASQKSPKSAPRASVSAHEIPSGPACGLRPPPTDLRRSGPELTCGWLPNESCSINRVEASPGVAFDEPLAAAGPLRATMLMANIAALFRWSPTTAEDRVLDGRERKTETMSIPRQGRRPPWVLARRCDTWVKDSNICLGFRPLSQPSNTGSPGIRPRT